MVKARGKKTKSRAVLMWGILAIALLGGSFSYSFGVNSRSQLAVFNEADIQCLGGADAKCPCKTGLKQGKCDPGTKGGGKIGCPCEDKTSGATAASGKCATVGKCLADKAGGMMPMLPMLPMLPMPMPDMPMPMMPSCPPTSNATTSSSTPDRRDPNCPPEIPQGGSSLWSSIFGGTSNTATDAGAEDGAQPGSESNTSSGSVSGTVWSRLLESLGLSSGGSNTVGTSGSTGGTNVSGAGSGTNTKTGTQVTITAATQHDTVSATVVPSNSAQITANGNTSNAEGGTVTTDLAFGGQGSTFSYSAENSLASNASGVLAQIAATLKDALVVVTSWFTQ